ncbi:MAG: alpha/beta fold hydrolase [Candidatus Latescibacterota bacterium]
MKNRTAWTAAVFIILFSIPLAFAQTDRRELGNLVIEGVPEIPQRIVDRMVQYQSARSAYLYDWDPTGKGMLISTRFAETSQLHYVQGPGGTRRQITFFPEPVGGAAMCPDSSSHGFLYTQDTGGGEFYQIFYFDLDNGDYTRLTDGSSRNGGMRWSNRGDRFAYHSTKRNGRDWDLYLGDLDPEHAAQPILQEGGTWFAEDWSPGDTRLLVMKYVSINESYCYALDIASGELSEINPTEGKTQYGSAVWSRDGKGIFLTSDDGSEFLRLRYYDLAEKNCTDLTEEIPWDVEAIELSRQGDRLAFTVNEDGISKLYLMDTRTKTCEQVPGIPVGQIYGLHFHPDGTRLAMVINTPQTPGDVYVLHIDDNALVRWTYSEVGGLDTEGFVVPELIHYETFDQVDGKSRMIPAFYYRPTQGKAPYPVLISIHGGPESQYVLYFSYSVQYDLNELGIAVVAPNVRGSSGYGKKGLALDNGYQREDSVKDIGKLLDWIEKQPELDHTRIAVQGGSYGGYMALAAMTHYNDRLKCGISNVGISNFVTFLENTQDYRRDLRRVEYGDESDPAMRAFLMGISPTTSAHRITKPLFVAQGLNDPRVPVGESEQMVSAVRGNGGQVWYVLAKDEGHGFRKKQNRDYYTNAVALFLEQYLLE